MRPQVAERLRAELFRWILADKRVEERDGLIVPRNNAVVAREGEAGGDALRIQ
jgi:hypothetical protein